MVMERKLSLSIYAAAFAISVIIFLAGIYVGAIIDQSNLELLSSELSTISQRVASTQLLMLMEGNSSSFCPVYSSELSSIDQEVETMGYKLSYLEEQKQVYDLELKKQYFVLEAESYMLSKKVNELCGEKSILLIHFYSNQDCPDCERQGGEILEARDLVASDKNVKLFSFDGDLGSPVADAFKAQYHVSRYPSVVINERTYLGYRDAQTLAGIMRNET